MKRKTLAWYVVLVASIAQFISAYTSNVVVIALPRIASAFLLSNIMQNWIVNVYLLTIAILSVPFGKICGKYGLKKSFLIGAIIFLIGAIGTILSINVSMLFIFRIIQGIGASAIFVSCVSIITKAVAIEERGKALGISIGSVYIGISFAPIIGGSLSYNFGWESIFIVTIPFILFLIWALRFKITEEWIENENQAIDIKGSVLYIIAIFLFMYGFTILNEEFGQILTAIGVIILILFSYFELKTDYPIFEIRLFKNKKFLSANIASIISYVAIFSISTILNYHFQYLRGWNSQITGLLLIATPIMQAIITPQSGKLSDRVNPQILAASGMTCVTIALLILVFLDVNTPLWIILIAMVLQGIGFGIFSSPNTNTIMSNVPQDKTSMASASVSTMRVLGQTLSIGILTLLFALIMGNVAISPSNYDTLAISCTYALAICTVMAFVSVLASLVGIYSD